MKLQLKWFNSDCLQHSEDAKLAVEKLNSALMDDFYWKLDTKNWELRLWDFTIRKLAPVVEDKIVKILEAMNIKSDKIDETRHQLQKLLKELPQS
jgi:hypothetical protein